MEGGREWSGLGEGGRRRKDEKWTVRRIQQRVDSRAPRLGAIQNIAAWRPVGGDDRLEDLWLDLTRRLRSWVVELSKFSSVCAAFFWLAEIQDHGVLAVLTEYMFVTGREPQKSLLPQPSLPAPRLESRGVLGSI